jgi:hypothetical protein
MTFALCAAEQGVPVDAASRAATSRTAVSRAATVNHTKINQIIAQPLPTAKPIGGLYHSEDYDQVATDLETCKQALGALDQATRADEKLIANYEQQIVLLNKQIASLQKQLGIAPGKK